MVLMSPRLRIAFKFVPDKFYTLSYIHNVDIYFGIEIQIPCPFSKNLHYIIVAYRLNSYDMCHDYKML